MDDAMGALFAFSTAMLPPAAATQAVAVLVALVLPSQIGDKGRTALMNRLIRIGPLMIAAIALTGTSAGAAEGETNDGGRKLISLTEVAPGLSPVSDYRGDIMNRSTMIGDPGGHRQALYERGVMIDIAMTQVVQGIVSGGVEEKAWGYNGLLDYGIMFDTGKLGLWSGGLLAATAQTSWSDPLTNEVGNLSPVNYTALFPRPFEPSTELMEYYFIQAFPKEIVVNVGRIIPTNFVDRNRFGNDMRNQFLNTTINNDSLWGYFIKFSTYSASLAVPLPKGFSFATAIWDPDTEPGDYKGVWKNIGWFGQLAYKWSVFGDLGGEATFIGVYTNRDAKAIDNPFFPPGEIPDNAPTKPNNWMVHLNIEQYLWKPDDAPGASSHVRTRAFDYQEPGIGLFFRFGYTPEDRNPWNITASGGIGARGVIPGRPYDRMGFGVYSLLASEELGLDFIPGDPLVDEVGIEAYYNFAITPWLQVSADIQWVDPGIASNDDAVVLGTRIFTQF